jgi:hypothetical protein
MKHNKLFLAIALLVAVSISTITALAGTADTTTTKNTPDSVSISNSPNYVKIGYDVGSIIPTDNARIYGEASASSGAHYVKIYGKLTGYADVLNKTASNASGSVSVSGQVEPSGVDQAPGSGYAEVRSGTSSTGTVQDKVSITVTN